MPTSERKPAKLKKRLPQTPARPKVVTKHMTPREAAQRLLELAAQSCNGK